MNVAFLLLDYRINSKKKKIVALPFSFYSQNADFVHFGIIL